MKALYTALEPGAQVAPDKEGRTAMHWTMASPSEQGSIKCLALLLKNAMTEEVRLPHPFSFF